MCAIIDTYVGTVVAMVFGESVMGTLLCSFHSAPPPNHLRAKQPHTNHLTHITQPQHLPTTHKRVEEWTWCATTLLQQYIATISPNNHQTCRRTDNYTVQHLPRTPLNVYCRENIPAHNTLCDDIVRTLRIHFPLITPLSPKFDHLLGDNHPPLDKSPLLMVKYG